MADIAVTAAQVAMDFPSAPQTVFNSYIAGVAVTRGQAVCIVAATGKLALADANASGAHQFLGVALDTCGIGGATRVVEQGCVAGFTLTALSYDDPVYLSDTAGALSTTAGTATVICGRVRPLPVVGGIVKTLLVSNTVTTVWS